MKLHPSRTIRCVDLHCTFNRQPIDQFEKINIRPKYVCKHLPRKNVLDLTIKISCRRKKERKRCATCIPYPVESLTEQPRPSLSALSAAAVFPTTLVHTHSDRKQPPLRLSTPEAVETLIVQYCYCQQRKDGVEIIPCG